jgi:adenylate cyclase
VAQPNKRFDWKILLLLPVPLLWAWLDHAGTLQRVENILLDLRFRYRGNITAPVKVFYVDVDTRAVQRIGERPWNRARFAEAAQYLYEYGGAKGVGFDFVFSAFGHSELVNKDDATKGNVALGRLARKYPQTILGAQYTRGESSTTYEVLRNMPLLRFGYTDRQKNAAPELPQYPIIGATLNTAWGTVGLIDHDSELAGDNTPRWAVMFTETPTTDFWHMGLQLACVELGVPPGSVRRAGDFLEIVTQDGRVLRRIPLAHQQLLEINWFSEWDNQTFNPRTSMADVLIAGEMMKSGNEADREQAREYFQRFAGAIVLIGPVDPLLQDLAPTPFDADPVPKVGMHGNLIKTILAEKYLHRLQPWTTFPITLGLTLIVTTFSMAGGARGLRSKLTAVLVLVAYVWLCLSLFADAHYVLPMMAPIGGAFTTAFIGVIWQLIVEEKQKGRIKNMFGTYLSPELVTQMVDSKEEPRLGGHKEEITAYFSDIQSFSTFSELMSPAQLVELMNEYLTACTDIVLEEKGAIDKYIGDAVVAFYNALVPVPDHAYRGCLTAVRVQQRIEELRQKWRSEGDKWPPIVHYLRARLGLNTGDAIVGNMGSQQRFSYTMMGDNVNLAARMESGAKSLGVYTMVTESTKLGCEQHGGDRIVFRFLDKIVVKGRTLPVPVYEVVGLRTEVPQQTFDCLGLHAQGIERYLAQDWDGAIRLFAQSAALERYQPSKAQFIESNPSLIMTERCHYWKKHPPGDNWDGVFTMKEK